MTYLSTWRRMTRPSVMVLMLAVIGLLYQFVDRALATYFKSFYFFKSSFIQSITDLGLGIMYIVGFLALHIFFRWIKPNQKYASKFLFLWLCVVVPCVICIVLKISLGRARPDLFFGEHLYGFYGFTPHSTFWSFPSGHTTSIMGVCLGLWALYPKYGPIFLMFGLAIALSRVLLIQHFLSDVIAATYLSFIEVGLIIWLINHKFPSLKP